MSNIEAVVAAIAAHGLSILLGVTFVLAFGATATAMHRSPVHRRRLGILTVIASALYLLAAAVPLPRPLAFERADQAKAELSPNAADAANADETPTSAVAAETITDGSALRLARDAAPTADIDAATQPEPEVGSAAPATFDTVATVPWITVRWIAASIWILGGMWISLRNLAGLIRLRALLARCTPAPSSLLRGIDLPNRTRVVIADRDLRPFCAGWWRSTIVLPGNLLSPEASATARAVLRHEVAHARANDARVWTLLAWLGALLWPHPLFWWLRRDIRFCSELIADDTAAGSPAERDRYARALLDLAEQPSPDIGAASTVAIFHRPSEFYRRIQMLLSRRGSLSRSTSRLRRVAQNLSLAGIVAVAASVFGMPAAAQDPAGQTTQPHDPELQRLLDAQRAELELMRDKVRELTAAVAAANRTLTATGTRSYVIEKGDTLPRIARAQVGDDKAADKILDLNPGLEATKLRIGQKILLPDRSAPLPTPVPPLFMQDRRELPAAALPTPASSEAVAELTSRYLDLQGQVKVQRLAASEKQTLGAVGRISEIEVQQATIDLQTTEKKLAIAAGLIEGEIAATNAEIAWIKTRRANCAVEEGLRLDVDASRAEARLRALRAAK
jgi:beta-lactamase regulating signal transducer with metallopeptidase domain/LysM repeat protein